MLFKFCGFVAETHVVVPSEVDTRGPAFWKPRAAFTPMDASVPSIVMPDASYFFCEAFCEASQEALCIILHIMAKLSPATTPL